MTASRFSQLPCPSLQLRVFFFLSAGFATAQPLHGCKSNKTSNELQMYCQTSLCPAHRKCRCMCCKMKQHRQPKYNYLQIQICVFKDKKTIKYLHRNPFFQKHQLSSAFHISLLFFHSPPLCSALLLSCHTSPTPLTGASSLSRQKQKRHAGFDGQLSWNWKLLQDKQRFPQK